MELKTYISETVKHLIDGVIDAQNYAKGKNAWVNPSGVSVQKREDILGISFGGRYAQVVEFDIAVTASEGDEVKGGIGIFVGPLGIGSQGQVNSSDSTINRIKFSLPVVLPDQRDNK